MVHPPQYVGAVCNDIVAGDQDRDEARADPHGRGQVQLWQDCQESHQVGLGYSHTDTTTLEQGGRWSGTLCLVPKDNPC